MVEHLAYIAKKHPFDVHPLNTNITKPSAEIVVFRRGFSLSVVELFAFYLLGDWAEAPGCSLFSIKLFSRFFAQFLPCNELFQTFSLLILRLLYQKASPDWGEAMVLTGLEPVTPAM